MLRVAASRLAPSLLRPALAPLGPCWRGFATKVVQVESDAEYDSVLTSAKDAGRLTVVDFTATWCPPCKKIAPLYDQLSSEHDDVTFVKVDIDTEDLVGTVRDAGIQSVPTFNFHKGGELVAQVLGANAQEIVSLVSTHK